MNISKVFSEDLKNILSDKNIPWEKLRGSSILITGATGAIGKIIVYVLGRLNKTNDFNIKIYAMGRNTEKGKMLEELDGVRFISADIREKINITHSIDYIIHCAAVTESAKMVADPVSVIETELQGGKNILEFARVNNVKGMVYTSSMEAYGILSLDDVKETDMGYIDLTSPRSSYSQSKRMIESMCNCYYSQYGLPVNIVRLGMTFGAGMDFTNDKRVWAQFARCVVNKSPIILHTTGESLTSILYMADAIKGILLVLLNEKDGETYNIATEKLKIRELAERIAKKFNLEVVIEPHSDLSKSGYASDFKLPLNSDKIKRIGWNPIVTEVEEMFERTLKGNT